MLLIMIVRTQVDDMFVHCRFDCLLVRAYTHVIHTWTHTCEDANVYGFICTYAYDYVSDFSNLHLNSRESLFSLNLNSIIYIPANITSLCHSTCIYIYIYRCVYIYIYICMSLSLSLSLCIYIYICAYIYIYCTHIMHII